MPVVKNEILISSCRPPSQLIKCQTMPGLLRVSSQAELEGRDYIFFFFFLNLPWCFSYRKSHCTTLKEESAPFQQHWGAGYFRGKQRLRGTPTSAIQAAAKQ